MTPTPEQIAEADGQLEVLREIILTLQLDGNMLMALGLLDSARRSLAGVPTTGIAHRIET